MDNRTSKAIRKDKTSSHRKIIKHIPNPDQPFYAMCDASSFGIGAALLQCQNGTNKMNLILANSRLFATWI